MANMVDYLLWRGDVALTEKGFNEVDSLVLCEICYVPWDGLLSAPWEGEILRLRDAAVRFAASGRKPSPSTDPRPALRLCALSRRFSAAGISDFVNQVDRDDQIQFCALTFHVEDGSLYAAFRGTDSTITGWREDFSFTYSRGTPAQEAAVKYLEMVAEKYPGPIRIGGHSKGGNLALYAASFCSEAVRGRVAEVYNYDGPGLNEGIRMLPGYVPPDGRLRLIIPEESVIGVVMNEETERTVVKSSASGFRQHDPMTWQVLGTSFVEAGGQSGNSVFVDRTVHRWLDGLSEKERRGLTEAIFDGMEATGADTVSEVKNQGIGAAGAFVKNFLTMDSEKQKDVLESVGKLVRAGGDQLVNGALRSVEGLKNIIAPLPSREDENKTDGTDGPAPGNE